MSLFPRILSCRSSALWSSGRAEGAHRARLEDEPRADAGTEPEPIQRLARHARRNLLAADVDGHQGVTVDGTYVGDGALDDVLRRHGARQCGRDDDFLRAHGYVEARPLRE